MAEEVLQDKTDEEEKLMEKKEKSLDDVLINISKATKMNEKKVDDFACADKENVIDWDVFLPESKGKEADSDMDKTENSFDYLSPT